MGLRLTGAEARRWGAGAGVLALALALAAPAWGTYGDAPRESVMVCDATGRVCLQPTAQGGLPGLSGGSSGGTGVALPQPVTTTPFGTPVTAGAVSQVRPSNASRKFLQYSNETGGDCHVAFGTSVAPSSSVGTLLSNRAVSTFESSAIDTNALQVFCANSGTITGLEGQ